jgi:hypothetical protein
MGIRIEDHDQDSMRMGNKMEIEGRGRRNRDGIEMKIQDENHSRDRGYVLG